MKHLKPLMAVGVLFPAVALSLFFMSGCEGQEKKAEAISEHETSEIQTLLDSNEQLKQKVEEMGRTIKSMERASSFAHAGVQLLAEVELIKRECPLYLKSTYKVSNPVLYVDYEPGLMSDRTGYVFTGCRIYRKRSSVKMKRSPLFQLAISRRYCGKDWVTRPISAWTKQIVYSDPRGRCRTDEVRRML